jgi:3',5'-cyclic AMP phosphodiesterase CpdA
VAKAEPVPKDDFACMPREPLLAILQTVIEEVAEEQRPEAIASGAPDDERRSGGGVSVMSDRHFAGLDLPRSSEGRRACGRFEVTKPKKFSDPRWLLSGVVIAWHKFKTERAEFGGLPSVPLDIADDARILLVGDWDSGTERARKVAAQMRRELDAGAEAGRGQHVIHLGDVYYTGSAKEYERYFLQNWPVRAGEDIASYNLVGNHDMYQRGHAYSELYLTDPRFSRQQGRSIFALRSTAWQFLALDSSYDDKALHGGQVDWIMDQLTANPHHRTALLSHHQHFSAYEDGAKPGHRPTMQQYGNGRHLSSGASRHHRSGVTHPCSSPES